VTGPLGEYEWARFNLVKTESTHQLPDETITKRVIENRVELPLSQVQLALKLLRQQR
jgi:hypothetical protein